MSQTNKISPALKITLLVASTLTVMSGAAVAPALPKISEAFSFLPNAELLTKLVLTIPGLMIAICSPFVGRLIDKHGRIRFFLFGMALYIISGSAGFWLPGMTSILISRAILGISIAINMTTATTLAGDYFMGEERNKFLGTQSALMALGGAIFVGAAGLLADVSWRHPFLNYLVAIPVLLLCWKYLYEPARVPVQGQTRTVSLNRGFPKTAWLIYFTSFFGMAMFYIIAVHHAYLIKEMGVEKSSFQSLGLILTTLFAFLSAMRYQQIASKRNFPWIYGAAFFLMGLFYIGTGAVQSIWLVVLFTGLSGIGAGLLMPNGNTWLLQIAPAERRGRFMGGMTTALFLGQFAAPILTQPLVNLSSLAGMHIITGGLMVFLGITFLAYARRN